MRCHWRRVGWIATPARSGRSIVMGVMRRASISGMPTARSKIVAGGWIEPGIENTGKSKRVLMLPQVNQVRFRISLSCGSGNKGRCRNQAALRTYRLAESFLENNSLRPPECRIVVCIRVLGAHRHRAGSAADAGAVEMRRFTQLAPRLTDEPHQAPESMRPRSKRSRAAAA